LVIELPLIGALPTRDESAFVNDGAFKRDGYEISNVSNLTDL